MKTIHQEICPTDTGGCMTIHTSTETGEIILVTIWDENELVFMDTCHSSLKHSGRIIQNADKDI